jgi:hypothetical protein
MGHQPCPRRWIQRLDSCPDALRAARQDRVPKFFQWIDRFIFHISILTALAWARREFELINLLADVLFCLKIGPAVYFRRTDFLLFFLGLELFLASVDNLLGDK